VILALSDQLKKRVRMCKEDILHSSSFGYVARCPNCQGVHVSFGTCWLTLTREEFSFMLRGANEQLHGASVPEDPQEKLFVCETTSSQVKISLSYYELFSLSELMNQAACVLSARDTLANQ
jgi:hypothetical protein